MVVSGRRGAHRSVARGRDRECQAEGIAIAKTKGKYKGRKRALTAERVDKAGARVAEGEGLSAIARDFDVGRSPLYRALLQRQKRRRLVAHYVNRPFCWRPERHETAFRLQRCSVARLPPLTAWSIQLPLIGELLDRQNQ